MRANVEQLPIIIIIIIIIISSSSSSSSSSSVVGGGSSNSSNPLTTNDPYMVRTAPLTSRCCILYIYSKKYTH